MARTRQQLTKLENWFLDHPLESNKDVVPGYEIFYTDRNLYMFPVGQRHLLQTARWDWKNGVRVSNVIFGLHKKVFANMARLQQEDNAEAITDNQPDEPAPWDTFDWSI